jgi:Protein of unknown function (DUF1749)
MHQQGDNLPVWHLLAAGHSTGCQDAVRYANRDGVQPLDAVILQAPVRCHTTVLWAAWIALRSTEPSCHIYVMINGAQVSDQDYLAMSSDTPDRIQLCERMVAEGHAEDIAFRYAPCLPCAQSCTFLQLERLQWAQGVACSDVSCRDDDGTPVTARRFLAVAKPGDDDDYFSFGFSHDERQVGWLVNEQELDLLPYTVAMTMLRLAHQ